MGYWDEKKKYEKDSNKETNRFEAIMLMITNCGYCGKPLKEKGKRDYMPKRVSLEPSLSL